MCLLNIKIHQILSSKKQQGSSIHIFRSTVVESHERFGVTKKRHWIFSNTTRRFPHNGLEWAIRGGAGALGLRGGGEW